MKQKLAILSNQIELSKSQNNVIQPQTVTARNQLRHDIENILAAECTMCGSLMINQLDKPFPDTNEQW
jgi:hypothetical protein